MANKYTNKSHINIQLKFKKLKKMSNKYTTHS